MQDSDYEVEHLREALKVCESRLKEYRELLSASLGILKSKDCIMLKKDDDTITALENFIERLSENGIVENITSPD